MNNRCSTLSIVVGIIVALSVNPVLGDSIGWSPSFFSMTVDDPDGNVSNESNGTALSVLGRFDTSKNTRWQFGMDYYDIGFTPSTTEIGQNVQSIQFSASHQHYIKLSRDIKFWAGYGLSYSLNEHTIRQTIDNEGFLQTSYDDRKEDEFGVLVNIGQDWKVRQSSELGYLLS